MPKTTVTVIADSVSPTGKRITSIECHYPRFIHAEMLRHGLLHARSVSSSRAIPTRLLIEQVLNDPVIPLVFGKNKPGMSANDLLPAAINIIVEETWRDAAIASAEHAKRLCDFEVHKEHVNRLLEPFIQVHELITATSWQNFLELRLANDAQPEIQELAGLIQQALAESEPKLLGEDEFHLPYWPSDLDEFGIIQPYQKTYVAAALCARLSYATYAHDQRIAESRETLGDEEWILRQLEFAEELFKNKHLTPFEHVARPSNIGWCDSFYGWQSLRHILRGDLEKR
jgi:hypothetical protein